MKENNKEFDTSIGSNNDWADAVERVGHIKLAERLRESEAVKFAGLEALKELGLPSSNWIVCPFNKFLSDSTEIFNELGEGKYYVNLVSDKWKDRKRAIDMTRDQIMEYIRNETPSEKRADYNVITYRYYENIYGGNIVIGNNGRVTIEMVEGKHIKLANGIGPLVVIAESNQFLKTIKYYEFRDGQKQELQNMALKKAVWQTLECIPKNQLTDNGLVTYHKGFYEFILTKKNQSSPLSPIFIDFSDDEKYQL